MLGRLNYNRQQIFRQLVQRTTELIGDDPLLKNRKRMTVMAKSALAMAMLHVTGARLSELAQMLDRDRTTIIHHRDLHSHRFKYEQDYRNLYLTLKDQATELWESEDELTTLIRSL